MRSLIVNLLLILLFSSSPAFAEDAKEGNPNTADTSADIDVQSIKFFPIPFAFGYIVDLAEDVSVKKPWWVRFKVGFQYDDNVLMISKEAPLPPNIPKKDDWRMIANLNGRYMFYKTQRFETVATYSFFQSLHNDLDDFNVTQNMAELYGKYGILPRVDLKVTYTFHHMLIGGDKFDHAHMILPRLIVKESKSLATHIDYAFRNTDYKDLPTFAFNSERTGDNRLFGITQYIVMPTPAMLRIGYSHDEEETRRDYLDSTGDKALIGLTYMPSASFLIDLYWEYNKRDYDEVNPYTGVKRKDTSSVMTFTVTQNITDSYGLNLRLYYMQNDSNVSDYDVTRFVPSLMLEMKY